MSAALELSDAVAVWADDECVSHYATIAEAVRNARRLGRRGDPRFFRIFNGRGQLAALVEAGELA